MRALTAGRHHPTRRQSYTNDAATPQARAASARELALIRLPVHPSEPCNLCDVRPSLRKGDAEPFATPAVDIALAGVVRGERQPRVGVAVEQVIEVPRPVAHVDLGVAKI